MLASPHPNDNSHPAFTAPQILKSYLDYGPSIFNETSASCWNYSTRTPKFDGKFLHEKAHELLQEARLHDTLTNVVIPTFDIKKMHPVIFSSFKALVAVSEVIQQLNEKNPNFIRVKANEPTKIVLLSLGCGTSKIQGIDARLAQFITYDEWIPFMVGGLLEVGEALLEKTVRTRDVTSFAPHEQPSEGTNAQALERFVQFY
ncbi:hypothetical protein TSUD_352790 [Trifolium subterraneum]|nr:hypothetical protein TSUD_352790 [Trifolium subterraneum]